MSVTHVGRYEIERTLGRGAMGIVYLARDPLIDRKVALKTLRLDVDVEIADEFRERFLREAQAAGRLNHPGIVTIHDVGEDRSSGVLYIAMEYIEGRDLKQIMASGHRFRPSEAARIVADVAVALDYAHQMGVIHRDIKPGNLILTHDGSARIADFGIARMESSNLTVDGQFIGTPNFMSPEQITAGPIDGRSDLFSLGVVLFTLLTGQRPFTGETMHQVTRKIVEDPPPIPSIVEDSRSRGLQPHRRQVSGQGPRPTLPDRSRAGVGPRRPRPIPGSARTRTTTSAPRSTPRISTPGPGERLPAVPDAAGRTVAAEIAPSALASDRGPNRPAGASDLGGHAELGVGHHRSLGRAVDRDHRFSDDANARRTLRRAVRRCDPQSEPHRDTCCGLPATPWRRVNSNAPDRLSSRPSIRRRPRPPRRALASEIGRRSSCKGPARQPRQRVAELVAEGRRAYRSGNYATAAGLFREALELDPAE